MNLAPLAARLLVGLLALMRFRLADLIIVLRDGHVTEQGSHDELMHIDGGVYRGLWEAQLTESTQSPGQGKIPEVAEGSHAVDAVDAVEVKPVDAANGGTQGSASGSTGTGTSPSEDTTQNR